MRRVALPGLVLTLLLVSGCKGFDLTRFWKLNRGENYMNDDGQFSIPARQPTDAPSAPETDRPE